MKGKTFRFTTFQTHLLTMQIDKISFYATRRINSLYDPRQHPVEANSKKHQKVRHDINFGSYMAS